MAHKAKMNCVKDCSGILSL